MADEYISEFDYALPWWRRIVEHSEGRYEVAYMVPEEAINRLDETSQMLWGKLQMSPLWPLLKDEQIIKDFMAALAEVNNVCKRQNLPPEVHHEPTK